MWRAFVKHIGWVCMVGEVSLRLGWDLAGSVGEGLNNGWDTDITMFSFPVGYCRGSPVSHADGPDFSGKWPLLHQDMKACAQSHGEGLRMQLVSENLSPVLGNLFPSWHVSPLMAKECRHSDPAFHQNVFTKANGCLPIRFNFLLSVLRELVFAQTLKLCPFDFVYIAVVFIF